MCKRVVMGNGTVAIVCSRGDHGRGGRTPHCAYCSRPVQYLCEEDARLAGPRTDRGSRSGGRTCDKGVCAQHATEVGPDKHLCWDCNRERLKREKEEANHA